MAEELFSSSQVAALLNVPYWVLVHHIRVGTLDLPRKGPSGSLLWTKRDIERARTAVADYKPRSPAIIAKRAAALGRQAV
jgi:hypothetical protein